MFRKIQSFYDLLRRRKMHGKREKVAVMWRDKNGYILVDKDNVILVSEVWRNA